MPFRAFLFGLLGVCALARPAAPAGSAGYLRDAARGDSLVRAGRTEEAIASILAAHTAGMSDDSLYWMLSEASRRKGALDTALGFNLAARTPAPGPFRDSVLIQRLRLYAAAGLFRDAAALRDSLPPSLRGADRRPKRLTARAGTGWFQECNARAAAPPFGEPIPGYADSGAEHRLQADLEAPFAHAAGADWIAGFETQGIKSYAKDSVDARLALTLREEGWLLPGLAFGLGAGGGRVTGSGWVGSCKGEGYWLSLGPDGFAMITGGVEAEWDENGRQRYLTGWLAWYRDASAGSGRGFSYSAGLSGFRSGPITQASSVPLIFVDDPRQASPTHYTDSTYDSAIAASPLTANARYTDPRNRGTRSVSSRAPQSFLAFSPQAAYTLPLPGKFAAEFSLALTGAWYPEAYRRDYAPLPSVSLADTSLKGLARSRADGGEYAVLLSPAAGQLEHYGAVPLRREERVRLEGQGSAQVTLRRAFGGWGALSLAALAKRYISNLGNAAPVWIPEWDAGISLQWNGAWEW